MFMISLFDSTADGLTGDVSVSEDRYENGVRDEYTEVSIREDELFKCINRVISSHHVMIHRNKPFV